MNKSLPVIVAYAAWNYFFSLQEYFALGAKRYLAMLAKLLGLLRFAPVSAPLVFRTAKKTIRCDRS